MLDDCHKIVGHFLGGARAATAPRLHFSQHLRNILIEVFSRKSKIHIKILSMEEIQ